METPIGGVRMISLNGHSWMIWEAKMIDLFYCKDLYAPVESESSKPETMMAEDWKKLDWKTINTIQQCVNGIVFHHVSNETSTTSLWKKLRDLYERKTDGNKSFLIQQKLINLKFKEDDSISEHLNKVQSIINQLAAIKIVLDDEIQDLVLLSLLSDSWETLMVSLSNSASDGVVSMNQVTSNLLNKKIRRKSSGSSHSYALVTENKGRSKSRQPQNRNNREEKQRLERTSVAITVEKVDISKRMPQAQARTKGRTNEKQEKNESATVVSATEIVLCSACEEDCANLTYQDSDWVIDYGASYYATP